MICIASADWPDLYYGVLGDVHLRPVSQNGHHDLGTFRFPSDTGVISRAFLLCGYDVS
jgi:hypothetical protein